MWDKLGYIAFVFFFVMMISGILDHFMNKFIAHLICDKYDALLEKYGYEKPIRAIYFISYRDERARDYCSYIIASMRGKKTIEEKIDDGINIFCNWIRTKKRIPKKQYEKKDAMHFNYKRYTNKQDIIWCCISLTIRYISYLSLAAIFFFGMLPYSLGLI